MDGLPTGTVTLLFTDIEGSTRLLDELGAGDYGRLLASHHRVCREAWAQHRGVEIDTAGDAFFVAFPTPSDALRAAAAAQGSLGELGLCVRMGVHTGEVSVAETGYVGLEVHRAARIAALAHGGQVVVSASTAALTDEPLTDLGEHRLKDITGRERLFQLGDHPFPPLRSLYRTNLPTPATAFIGRQAELAGLVELLGEDDARLVTLTGPGGAGKTRLALQAGSKVADDFPDGVWWVPLAAVPDASFVVPAIAQLLDIAEQPGRPLAETIVERLLGRRLLLVIDNAEHLLPDLQDHLLALLESPGVVLLLTSRERLRLQAERTWPVAPLQPPDSVALFEARARSIEPEFRLEPAVGELCERLDHLPLAIELAAARSSVFTPAQLLERLSQRLDLLEGPRDLDDRHRTLRATIAWSIDLLPEPERRLAHRLSIFNGGSTYEHAEAICGATPDTLQALVDKSLVRRRNTELGPRYSMLETIREFARDQLGASGEEPALARRHAAEFAELANAAQPHLRGDAQERWLTRLDADVGNLRAALDWLGAADEREQRLGMAVALGDYWIARGRLAEAHDEVMESLLAAGPAADDLQSEALSLASFVAYRQGAYEAAEDLAERSLAAARRSQDPALIAQALSGQAAVIVATRGDVDRGRSLYEEALELARDANDVVRVARTTHNLADLSAALGDLESARKWSLESLRLFGELRDATGQFASLVVAAAAEIGLGHRSEGASYLRSAIDLSQRLQDRYGLALCIELAAGICATGPDAVQAARLLGGAARLRAESGSALEPTERAVHERSLAAIESRLASHELAEASADGAGLGDDDLVAEALAGLVGLSSQPIR